MFYNHFLGKKFVEAKVTDIAASKDNTYGVSSFKFTDRNFVVRFDI